MLPLPPSVGAASVGREERERVRYKKEEESKSDDDGVASHGRLPTHDRVGLAAAADRRKLS